MPFIIGGPPLSKREPPPSDRPEKRTEQIKVLVDERTLRDLQEMALQTDRGVSECVRYIVRLHLYGHARLSPPRDKNGRD